MDEGKLPVARGIKGLRAGQEKDIGYTNWHAVSAAIEGIIDNLSYRSVEEMLEAMQQLETLLPELSGEIGEARDTLDLKPVGPIKKVAAMVFSSFFSELKNVVRRAELREDAQTKLKSLERVLNQLRELRQNLSTKIDDLLALRLREKDPGSYGEYQKTLEEEVKAKVYLERAALLLKNRELLIKLGEKNVIWDDDNRHVFHKGKEAFNAFLQGYTGQSKIKFENPFEIVNRMDGIVVELREKLMQLAAKKAAILEPIKREATGLK